MSAQAGILYRDHRPVPAEVIDILTRFNRVLAPHRDGQYVADGVALLSFGLHFDQLATQEVQPVRTADGCVLTWDGRLDNRNDFLIRQLPELRDDRTDAMLVALALQKFGKDDTLPRLIGDWSLARWDSNKRELMLARDYVNSRPLYYCCRPDYFIWSTSIDAIVVICDLVGKVNERCLVGHIMGPRAVYETWYEGLVEVPAGSYLLVDSHLTPRIARYFFFESSTTRFKNQRDYGDRYRELLTEAVAVRLRSRLPVWTELSGGYDSSSITCIASSLVDARAVESPDLQLVSRVMPSSPESDESTYIESVERWCRRTSRRLAIDVSFSLDPPTNSSGLSEEQLIPGPYLQPGEDVSYHVLLSGVMGDAVGGSVPSEVALLDRLKSNGFSSFLTASLAHCRNERRLMASLLWSLLGAALLPGGTLPMTRGERLAHTAELRHMSARDGASKLYGLRETLLQRASLSELPDDRDVASLAPVARALARNVLHFARCGIFSSLLMPCQIRQTAPFSHRPLVTYLMSLPPSALVPDVASRSFVRASMRDVLPPAVLNRLNKGYAAPVATRSFRRVAMEALDSGSIQSWELVKRDYMDPAIVTDILKASVDGSQSTSMLVTDILDSERLLRRTCRRPDLSRSSLAGSAVA